MVVKPVIYDNGLQRQVLQGDTLGAAEILGALATVGAGTLTAVLLTGSILNRTGPTGAYTDTTDTAANIINALIPNIGVSNATTTGLSNGVGVQPGTTWRLRYINTVAFAMTLAAGTGVTLAGNVNVNASSVKDYLLTITNGTPQQIFTVNQTNGSAVLTGLSQFQTAQLSIGMAVTGSGLSGTIISIVQGQSVTLSANASSTLSGNNVTFSPTVTIQGLGQGLL